MALDIESIVKQVVSKLTGNNDLIESFKKDPAAVLKKLGIDLDSEQVKAVAKAVLAKLNIDDAAGILNKIKRFFGK